jgi:hypothetical protein
LKRSLEAQLKWVLQLYGVPTEKLHNERFTIIPMIVPSGRGYYEMKMGIMVQEGNIYIEILEPISLRKKIIAISLAEAQRNIEYSILGDSISIGFPKCPGVLLLIPLKYRSLMPNEIREGVDYAA